MISIEFYILNPFRGIGIGISLLIGLSINIHIHLVYYIQGV
jgi:hypothetical protein